MTALQHILVLGAKIGHSLNESSSSKPVTSRPVIEDYQLPLKYRRKLLDESEINAINVIINFNDRLPRENSVL